MRDPRGFAVKFYTEEGNWDLTGNNTPIFFIRDALLVSVRRKNVTVCAIMTRAASQTCHACLLCTVQFPSFIHTQKRNPQTHMKDPDMVWDFWSLRPESLHQVPAAHPEPAAEHAYKRRRDMLISMKTMVSLGNKCQWLHISCRHLHKCNCVPMRRHTGFFKIVVTMTEVCFASQIWSACLQVSFLFSDRGLPDGYRHMNGYGSHTFKLVNANGECIYCKFHFKVCLSSRSVSL